MAKQGLDGFVVPHADAHQNEFLAPDAERLAWLTGFTGSAGTAVVLADRAALLVDGRYTLQVRSQVDAALYSFHHVTEEPLAGWLEKNLSAGQELALDPWLHTQVQIERLHVAVEIGRANV